MKAGCDFQLMIFLILDIEPRYFVFLSTKTIHLLKINRKDSFIIPKDRNHYFFCWHAGSNLRHRSTDFLLIEDHSRWRRLPARCTGHFLSVPKKVQALTLLLNWRKEFGNPFCCDLMRNQINMEDSASSDITKATFSL